jgi:hypothetical protein
MRITDDGCMHACMSASVGFYDECVGGGCTPKTKPSRVERPFQREELSNVYSGRLINNTDIPYFRWLIGRYMEDAKLGRRGRIALPDITMDLHPVLVAEFDKLFNTIPKYPHQEPRYTYRVEVRNSVVRERVQREYEGFMHTDVTDNQVVATAFIHFTIGHKGQIEIQPTRMYQTPPIWRSMGRELITIAHMLPPVPESPQEKTVYFARVNQIDNNIPLDDSRNLESRSRPQLGMGPVDQIDPNELVTIGEDTSYVQLFKVGAFEGIITEIAGKAAPFFAEV